MKAVDLTGQVFGRLTVIERAGSVFVGRRGKVRAAWRCRCDCGADAVVPRNRLTTGMTKSCGCLSAEVSRNLRLVHGGCKTRGGRTALPEYGVWQSMRRRCGDPADMAFANYGGRGIVVCERWRESLPAFLEDMGSRPTSDHEIDRIDNDRGYEPGNCRWVTRHVQSRNRSDNRNITHDGVTMCLTDWAARTGLARECIAGRLDHGWPVEAALTAPTNPMRQRKTHRAA